MKHLTKNLLLILPLLSLTACDRIANDKRLHAERGGEAYRSAMAEYREGRLDNALATLDELVAREPGNTSARFQLACLLQDGRKDYLNAFIDYSEYLHQAENSDKAPLAKERLEVCERELAKSLATKYGLNSAGAAADEISRLTAELARVRQRAEKLDKDLAAAMRRVNSLKYENEKLVTVMKQEVAPVATNAPTAEIAEAKSLLDSVGNETDKPSETSEDEIKEAAALGKEGENEQAPILVSSTRPKQEPQVEKKPVEASTSSLEKMPDDRIYTVKDGDTLYKIATRFYGHSSMWRKIREANKAIISMDGRVKKGQKLKLP